MHESTELLSWTTVLLMLVVGTVLVFGVEYLLCDGLCAGLMPP